MYKNWDKEGQLVAFFFLIVKSNFPICKTFLKADLFLRNCQTSIYLVGAIRVAFQDDWEGSELSGQESSQFLRSRTLSPALGT